MKPFYPKLQKLPPSENISLDGRGQRHAILVSRWNESITSRLLDGCISALVRMGVEQDAIQIFYVPGAFELGPASIQVAKSGLHYDAVICLGCVIRGETPHFDYVATEAARLIAQSSYDSGLPVIFGVLTVDHMEQAILRSPDEEGGKGRESAKSAVEMVNLYKELVRKKRTHK